MNRHSLNDPILNRQQPANQPGSLHAKIEKMLNVYTYMHRILKFQCLELQLELDGIGYSEYYSGFASAAGLLSSNTLIKKILARGCSLKRFYRPKGHLDM